MKSRHPHASNGHYVDNKILLAQVAQAGQPGPGFNFNDVTRAFCEPDLPFNSKRFLTLLSTISERGYDFIVVHTPPVLGAGDASWLAPFVDGVILTATWGKTTEDQLADATAQLRMNRANLFGTVINQVDPRIHARRGYGGFVMTEKLASASGSDHGRVNGSSFRPNPTPPFRFRSGSRPETVKLPE